MSITKEEYMQKYYQKAEVLIEALPYIQKYNRKVIVVKYGGSAMSDEELKKNVIKDVTLLKLVGYLDISCLKAFHPLPDLILLHCIQYIPELFDFLVSVIV